MSDDNQKLQQRRIAEMLELFPEDVGSVLDVGCGRGELSRALSNRFQRVVTVDIDFDRLAGLSNPRCQADLFRLPFADARFDLVLLSEVLEHLEAEVQKQALEELARVADRYLLVSVPWRQKLIPALVRCPDCRAVFHVSGHVQEFFDESDVQSPPGFQRNGFNLLVTMPRAPQMEVLAGMQHRLGAYLAPASPPVYCPDCRSYVTADSSAPLAGRAVRSLLWRMARVITTVRPTAGAGWAAWLFERDGQTIHVKG